VGSGVRGFVGSGARGFVGSDSQLTILRSRDPRPLRLANREPPNPRTPEPPTVFGYSVPVSSSYLPAMFLHSGLPRNCARHGVRICHSLAILKKSREIRRAAKAKCFGGMMPAYGTASAARRAPYQPSLRGGARWKRCSTAFVETSRNTSRCQTRNSSDSPACCNIVTLRKRRRC
jgi:hypothetical protein